MPTYISLIRWTQKGIEGIKDSPSRHDMAKQAYKSVGAELKEMYMVMGQYDLVIICDVPGDETAAKLSLTLGARGNIRTETFRAFTEDEYRKIVADLP